MVDFSNVDSAHNARISGAALPRPAACDCYGADLICAIYVNSK
jgi:hypothetical protein